MNYYPIAFLAGIMTILSPCIFPILPIILFSSAGKSKLKPLWVTLGLVISFTFFGILFGVLGSVLGINRETARLIGIILILILGVLFLFPALLEKLTQSLSKLKFHLTKPWRLPAGLPAGRQGRQGSQAKQDKWWSNLLLGLALGLAWTPCAGPVLGTILSLTLLEGNILHSSILMLIYGLGTAVPLLAIGYLGNILTNQINWLKKYLTLIQRIAGGVIIVIGIAMLLKLDQYIQRLFLT